MLCDLCVMFYWCLGKYRSARDFFSFVVSTRSYNFILMCVLVCGVFVCGLFV